MPQLHPGISEGEEDAPPRVDEVYRGQIDVMRRAVEKLTHDNTSLRKSCKESELLVADLKRGKSVGDAILREQSDIISMTKTLVEGERRAAESEWSELCEELQRDVHFMTKRLEEQDQKASDRHPWKMPSVGSKLQVAKGSLMKRPSSRWRTNHWKARFSLSPAVSVLALRRRRGTK